jgi:hypothetical protein
VGKEERKEEKMDVYHFFFSLVSPFLGFVLSVVVDARIFNYVNVRVVTEAVNSSPVPFVLPERGEGEEEEKQWQDDMVMSRKKKRIS